MPDERTIEARFEAMASALRGADGVTIGSRRGFGANALQVNGRIFAMLSGGRVVLKLPRDRVAELLASGEGVAFDAGKGKPMKEWVALEGGTAEDWRSLAEEARDFVSMPA